MPPSTAQAFTKAARSRLSSPNASPLPHPQILFYLDGGVEPTPTAGLYDILAHARALYGAGMGLTSFGVFASIIRTALGLRWTSFGAAADAFALIDGDICQAIQSSKEEIDSGRGGDLDIARAKVADLRAALKESSDAVSRWGGDFPFDRAAATLDVWKFWNSFFSSILSLAQSYIYFVLPDAVICYFVSSLYEKKEICLVL
jgi:hypothetical protein